MPPAAAARFWADRFGPRGNIRTFWCPIPDALASTPSQDEKKMSMYPNQPFGQGESTIPTASARQDPYRASQNLLQPQGLSRVVNSTQVAPGSRGPPALNVRHPNGQQPIMRQGMSNVQTDNYLALDPFEESDIDMPQSPMAMRERRVAELTIKIEQASNLLLRLLPSIAPLEQLNRDFRDLRQLFKLVDGLAREVKQMSSENAELRRDIKNLAQSWTELKQCFDDVQKSMIQDRMPMQGEPAQMERGHALPETSQAERDPLLSDHTHMGSLFGYTGSSGY